MPLSGPWGRTLQSMGSPGVGELATILLVALILLTLIVGVIAAFVRVAGKKSDPT